MKNVKGNAESRKFDKEIKQSKKYNAKHPLNSRTTSAFKLFDETFQNKTNKTLLVEKTNTHKYFVKKYHPHSLVPQCSAYSAAICRFLATDRYVPSVHIYKDSENNLSTIASKEIKGFLSNHDVPLTLADVDLQAKAFQMEQLERQLKNALLNPYAIYSKMDINCPNKDLFFELYPKAQELQNEFIDFLRIDNFSEESIDTLGKIIQSKIDQSDSDLSTKDLVYLNHIEMYLSEIKNLQCESSNPDINIAILEEFDRYYEEFEQENKPEVVTLELEGKSYEISYKELENYRKIKGQAISLTTSYIYKEGDKNSSNFSSQTGKFIDFEDTKYPISFMLKKRNLVETIFREPNDETFECSADKIYSFPDLHESNLFYWPTKQPDIYKIILDFCEQMIPEVFESLKHIDLDNKNNHFAQIAKMIYRMLLPYINNQIQEKYSFVNSFCNDLLIKIKSFYLQKSEEQLHFEYNLQELKPIILEQLKLIKTNYSSKIRDFETSLFESYGNPSNKFSLDDNLIYKSLTFNPVFIFHKYKTFIKAILTDMKLYEALADLNIHPDNVNLKNSLLKDERLRMDEIHDALLESPDFGKFFEQHGEFVFELIKEEFKHYKEYYVAKLELKPYYESLVKAIDFKKMEENFEILKEEVENPCFVLYANSPI